MNLRVAENWILGAKRFLNPSRRKKRRMVDNVFKTESYLLKWQLSSLNKQIEGLLKSTGHINSLLMDADTIIRNMQWERDYIQAKYDDLTSNIVGTNIVIPADCWISILMFLNMSSLRMFALTCHDFRDLVFQNDGVVLKLLIQRYNCDPFKSCSLYTIRTLKENHELYVKILNLGESQICGFKVYALW